MNTYFIDAQWVKEDKIYLKGDLCHHLSNVLRIKKGVVLHFSDGTENVYDGEIAEISKNEILVEILTKGEITKEPPIEVTLIQCLPRGDKMEQIIQKTVELGIGVIVPVESMNSQVRLKNKGEEKAKRWQKIAASAGEQCGRERIPLIARPTSLKNALESLDDDAKIIFCYEKEGIHSLKKELSNFEKKQIALIVGPEGGFSDQEAELIKNCGGVSITMGPRILRTETAGPTGLAAIMYELGDWGCLVEN